MSRLRALLSAYACEPAQGSEPGVGWHIACEMAKYHEVWVLTRANNRLRIEAARSTCASPRLQFVYYDLPAWSRWWKRGRRGVQLYYYLWQIGAYFVARRLHREVGFDLVHHVTFGKYWVPSFLALLPVPFVWGPVGGAESAPRAFWASFGLRGKSYEAARELGRWLCERDPFVSLTARRSAVALAKTGETADRLRWLGARDIRLCFEAGLRVAELNHLAGIEPANGGPIRFIGIGNLLHLKGFHLAILALAETGLDEAEYWIVGDGPERSRLERLAQDLGIANRVHFWGRVSREEALRKLGQSHVLVQASLHDSGGWVCVEAMAAGRPVICLRIGGPAVQVTEGAGLRVAAQSPQQAVRDLAAAMRRLAHDAALQAVMAGAGRQRSAEVFCWESKGELLDGIYRQVAGPASGAATQESRRVERFVS